MKTHYRITFNHILRWWRAILERFAVPGMNESEGLDYWRSRTLQHVVAVAFSVGVFVLAPTLVFLVSGGYWKLAVFDTAVYLALAAMMTSPALTYRIRAAIILLTMYALGVWVMATLGVMSGGPVWLFSFAVMAGILFGFKAAVGAILINALTLGALGFLRFHGYSAVGQPAYTNVSRAITSGANFLFLNAMVALSIAGLTQGLQSVIIRAREARDRMVKEVDARKQTERFLRASEEKYRLLAENLSDILWSLDTERNLTYISPAATTMLGWTADELPTLTLGDVLTEGSMEKVTPLITELLSGTASAGRFETSDTIVLEMNHKAGTTIPVEVRGALMRGEDERPLGIIGIARDISAQIETRKEREILQAKLAQSKKMEAIGLLASGVAHDLNNVLSGIVSYPDLLLLDLPPESPLRKPLETIRGTGNKAAEIVQDLLVLARRNVQEMNALCINHVVEEHLRSAEHRELLSRYPAVEVQTELAPNLPAIRGSSIHLKKALMNLVINATEAQPEGGRITVRSLSLTFDQPPRDLPKISPGTYVCLEVADHGVGIPEEDLQRIFEPFFTRKVMGRSGSGLGMSVVWGTVEDHDGFISVARGAPRGTTFKLYFPATGERPRASQPPDSEVRHPGNGETVLVVDDVAEQRDIAAGILQRLGYEAVTVASGEAAVDYLERCTSPVDAVILDMIMPGMDGLDTYRRIRALDPDVNALIASGFSETERVREALKLGVGAYVRKPYTLREIGSALHKILAGNRS